jgi:ABC-2 type transport system permease protein
MINTIWSITKKDLLQILKERNACILMLVVPVILVAILGTAFSNGIGGNSQPVEFTVAVSNKDDGYISKTLLTALQAKNASFKIALRKYDNTTKVLQQVSQGYAVVGLVIPAKTTQYLTDAAHKGRIISNIIQFYAPPNSTDQRVAITQQIVTNVINRQVDSLYSGSAAVQQVVSAVKQIQQATCHNGGVGYYNYTNTSSSCSFSTSAINVAKISKAVGEASPTNKNISLVQLRSTGSAPKVSSFDRSLPGFAILFALFGLNTTAASILQEKDDGTFRRLLIAPIPRYALLGGKLVAQFVVTLFQLTMLFTIGYLVFKLNIGSWQVISLLLISTSFATTGLGMLLVSLLKTRRQLTPVVTLTTLVTSAIGGSWWPLWSEPQWMQQVAKIGVTAWALEGLNGVMIFGKSFAEVKFDILGLLGYGLICFLLALRLFRFQEKGA